MLAHYERTWCHDGSWSIWVLTLSLGGGRVTQFPFSPLNVFVYISYWATQVNSQNRSHFEGDYISILMFNKHASWCDSIDSKSKKHNKTLLHNRNMILLILISFLDWIASAERFLCDCYWNPMPEHRVPWGYSNTTNGRNMLWNFNTENVDKMKYAIQPDNTDYCC